MKVVRVIFFTVMVSEFLLFSICLAQNYVEVEGWEFGSKNIELKKIKIKSADHFLLLKGIDKAKELGAKPMPISDIKNNYWVFPPKDSPLGIDTLSGKLSLIEGDMLINIGEKPISLQGGESLKRREYAIVKDKQFKNKGIISSKK